MNLFFQTLLYELQLSRKAGSDFLSTSFFFLSTLAICSFFLKSILWVGPELSLAISWFLTLCAYLMSIEKFYSRDLEDGSLEFYKSFGGGMYYILAGKSVAHWMLHGLPISFLSISLCLFYYLPLSYYPLLLLSYAMGTFVLSMLSFMCYSLTFRLRYRGPILSILLLPLCIPLFMININLVDLWSRGETLQSAFQLYLSVTFLICIVCNICSFYAFKYSLE